MEVTDAAEAEGIAKLRKFKKIYQFASFQEYLKICREKVSERKFFLNLKASNHSEGYNATEIARGCGCGKVNLVGCRNKTEIPKKFPSDVRRLKWPFNASFQVKPSTCIGGDDSSVRQSNHFETRRHFRVVSRSGIFVSILNVLHVVFVFESI